MGISTIIILNVLALNLMKAIRKQRDKDKLHEVLESEKRKVEEISYFTRLDKFKNNLISMNQFGKITGSVNKFLTQVFEFEKSSFFLWNEDEGAFISYPNTSSNIRFFVYDPFLLWISENDKIFFLDEILSSDSYRKISSNAEQFFYTSSSNIILPLILNQSLIGFIACSSKQKSKVDEIKLNRLYEIKSTVLISISNAIFYARTIALTENLEAKVKERTKELEEAQSQLVMSEKMASLGVMVAGIAHEINTPAGVINGSTENMDKGLNFLISKISSISQLFKETAIQEKFSKIMEYVLSNQNTTGVDSKEKFKVKKMLREKFSNSGLNQKLSDDLTELIVETNLVQFQDELEFLVKEKGFEILDLLSQSKNLDRNLKNIKYSIKNIVRIVKALKYYSHLDQASFAEADLVEGIENILIILHNQMKHGILIEKDFQKIPLVECNLDEINQVWTNILQNASQALKGNGKIKISTYEDDSFVGLDIEDNGPGIPPEIIDRIWDPFFTTKDQGEGTGLGLGIVKGIIEKHKGKISVKSKPGETIFKILLPKK